METPKTVDRIRSTGTFGQFPGAVLAAVGHDTYILEAEVAKLVADAEARAERDALAADGAGVFWAEKARAFAMQMASVDARAKDAESERDRLAAANAALEAKVAGLRDFVDDFAKAKIDALRYSPPCGSSPEDDPDPVVDAETVWAWQADAKAALATQEAGNAQSTPPISPEEAQFNAVRYHERFGPLDEKGNPVDPRRRG